MKKIFLLPFAVMALHFTAFSQAATWQPYTNLVDHYTVSFPGKPEVTAQYDSSTAVIMKITLVTLAVGDDAVFMSSSVNMAGTHATEKPIKDFLEDSRNGSLQSMNVSESKTLATVTTGSQPYIEFTFSTESFTGKDRIYFIDNVQYSLISIFGLKNGLSPDADKFIKSFKHL